MPVKHYVLLLRRRELWTPGSKLVEGDSSSGEFITSTTYTPGSDGARFHHIIPSAAMLQVTHALKNPVVNSIPLPVMILFPGHSQSVGFEPSRHWLTMGMEVTMVLDQDPGHDMEMVDVNALGFSDVVHDMKEADFQVALSRALLAPVILSGVQVAAAHACNSSHLFHDGTDNVGIIPPLSSASSSLPASFDLAVEGGGPAVAAVQRHPGEKKDGRHAAQDHRRSMRVLRGDIGLERKAAAASRVLHENPDPPTAYDFDLTTQRRR